jgi:hypothetical protein
MLLLSGWLCHSSKLTTFIGMALILGFLARLGTKVLGIGTQEELITSNNHFLLVYK